VSGDRGRRPYPPEFKREAVQLYRRSGKSLQVIAGEFGVAVESLRSWNKQHDIDAGAREGLTTPEREELREVKRKLLRDGTRTALPLSLSRLLCQEIDGWGCLGPGRGGLEQVEPSRLRGDRVSWVAVPCC
jgi:transposase-like protein